MARLRIGDLLIKAGLIDEMQLSSALAQQRSWGGRLGDALVELGFLDEMMLWRGLSKQLGLPMVGLAEHDVTPALVAALPLELATKHNVFPYQDDGRELVLATSEPNDLEAQDEIAFKTGRRLRVVLAPPREVTWAIGFYYQGLREPCPPPKTRRSLGSTEGAPVGAAPGRPGAEPPRGGPPPGPALHLAQVATPLAGLGAPSPEALDRLEAELRQTTRILRLLVDRCVDAGLFTRDDYLNRIRRLSS